MNIVLWVAFYVIATLCLLYFFFREKKVMSFLRKKEDDVLKNIDLEENNFILTEKILEKYITPKTKLIILTYPNNPSGITLPEEEIVKIVKFLKDKEIYIFICYLDLIIF